MPAYDMSSEDALGVLVCAETLVPQKALNASDTLQGTGRIVCLAEEKVRVSSYPEAGHGGGGGGGHFNPNPRPPPLNPK